jgi:hypothetical protein
VVLVEAGLGLVHPLADAALRLLLVALEILHLALERVLDGFHLALSPDHGALGAGSLLA